MQSVLIVIHLMIVVALVVVVLLQRSEGGALGVSGGGGFMTGRGQANALTRATAILAALFFATSLGLTFLARLNQAPEVIFQSLTPIEPGGRGQRGRGRQGGLARPIATDGRPGGEAARAAAGRELAGSKRRRSAAIRPKRAGDETRRAGRLAVARAACRAPRSGRAGARRPGSTVAGEDRAAGFGAAMAEMSTGTKSVSEFMCKRGGET